MIDLNKYLVLIKGDVRLGFIKNRGRDRLQAFTKNFLL